MLLLQDIERCVVAGGLGAPQVLPSLVNAVSQTHSARSIFRGLSLLLQLVAWRYVSIMWEFRWSAGLVALTRK